MRAKRIMIVPFLIVFSLFSSCNDENDSANQISVTGDLIVSKEIYDQTAADGYTVKAVEIIGDSLKIEICSGGCSTESWKMKLVDAGLVAESFPEQRWTKAFLIKEVDVYSTYPCGNFSVDISPLQTGSGKLSLHLAGWGESILYSY